MERSSDTRDDEGDEDVLGGMAQVDRSEREGGGAAPVGVPPAHGPTVPLPALTSLRFVAAFAVLVFHYHGFYFGRAPAPAPVRLGFTGVTFFFLLSGFILAYTYHRVDLGCAPTRQRYLWARFARVYPAFLFSLLLNLPWFAAWVIKTAPPLQYLMASSAVLAPLGLHAWVPGAACALNCASWSISVEAFFYVLFPFLLAPVLRRPALAGAVAVAAWIAFAVLCTFAWDRAAPGLSLLSPEDGGTGPVLLAQVIKYDPLLRLPEFVAGILLFALFRRWRPSVSLLALLTLAAGTLLLLADPLVPEPVMHNGLSALAWAPLVLLGAVLRSGPLTSAPAVFLGRISFALYLLHMPVFSILANVDRAVFHGDLAGRPWLAAIAATAVSLAGAVLLHLLVEEPARRALLRAAWPGRIWAALTRSPRPGSPLVQHQTGR